jgi:lipoyl(octanoyl) transferase
MPCAAWRSIFRFGSGTKFGWREGKLQRECWIIEAGLIGYTAALELQRRLVEARKSGDVPDVLLFCEHPHVITLGRNGKMEHLRAGDRLLAQMNVEFEPTDRGGDITYHGPGQIVGYPILDLTQHRRDVRWYVEQLEEMMIRATADFGVRAGRAEGRHGIWVESSAGEEKLAALGVRLSRWITSHGFAYNVSTDLRYFDLIVPCGIADRRATSLERILERAIRGEDVRHRLAFHFGDVFQREMVFVTPRQLEEAVAGNDLPPEPFENAHAPAESVKETRA